MGTQLVESQVAALREWIHRLRTTNHVQGKGALHTEIEGEHSWCCLGIGAEIAAEQRVIESEQYPTTIYGANGTTLRTVVHSYDGSLSRMTPRLRNVFGIDAMAVNRLIYLNDSANLTFPQIADYLEQEFLSDHDTDPGPARNDPAESVGPRTA